MCYYSLCYVKQERESQGKSQGWRSGKRWSSLPVKLEKRWNTMGSMKVVLKKKCLNSNGKTWWEDQPTCSVLSPPICHFQGKNVALLGRCGVDLFFIRKQEHFFVVVWRGEMTTLWELSVVWLPLPTCPVKWRPVWETLKPTKETWRATESRSCFLIQGVRRIPAQQVWECVAWERADGWRASGKLGCTFCLRGLRDSWSHSHLAMGVLTLILTEMEGIGRGQKWAQRMCFGAYFSFSLLSLLSLLWIIAVVVGLAICGLVFPYVPFSLCALT